MTTSTIHTPKDSTEINRSLAGLVLVLFLVLGFLLFGRAARLDSRPHSRVRPDAFPGWPPNLPPTQYASFLATWRAHQTLLHESLQQHQRHTGLWEPIQLLWERLIILCEWVVAGTLSLLKLLMLVFRPIPSWIVPVTAFAISVLLLLAFALVTTLVIVVAAWVTLVRERRKRKRRQKPSLVVKIPRR
ncbi:hypothetical protein N7486_008326 [Penicillium sp. IBT 16267x]|nr:hypothetical protein N7486_008326 [Penicillium sp. IBT 16267x]